MSTKSIAEENHLAPPLLADPYPFFARTRREAPVFHSPLFHVWMVTRYEDAEAVLKDPTSFSSADSLKPPSGFSPEVREILGEDADGVYPLVASDPPEHSRVRNLVAKAFTAQRIAALEPEIRSIAGSLIDAFAARGEADLMRSFARPLPQHVTAALYGVPASDMESIQRWCDDELMLNVGQLSPEEAISCARSVAAFRRYLRDLIADRRRSPKDDLVTALVHAEQGSVRLSEKELVGLFCVLIFAAHETTSNMLGNTLLQLLQQPGAFSSLAQDPRRIPLALEEGLRFDAPVQGMMRTATRDAEVGGVTIPKGARLLVLFASANRDEAIFPSPERFDIDRSRSAPHMSFGRGAHFCIGASLARLEGRIALELLCQRLPDARLLNTEDMQYLPNLVHRGPRELRVVWRTTHAA